MATEPDQDGEKKMAELPEMELETSTKAGSGFVRPLIRKGYYAGQLVDVREFKDDKGNWLENKYGPQIICDFQLFHVDPESNTITKPVTFKDGNMEKDVVLGAFLNISYKDTDKQGKVKLVDGKPQYRTAITPNGRITKVFMALGWKGPAEGEKLKPREFIGKVAEINVDDYEKDGVKSSTIKDVKKFDGKIPPDFAGTPVGKHDAPAAAAPAAQPAATPAAPKEIPAELQAKIDRLTKLKEEGMLTEGGYKDAVEQLKKQAGL